MASSSERAPRGRPQGRRQSAPNDGSRWLVALAVLQTILFGTFLALSFQLFPNEDMVDWMREALGTSEPIATLWTPHNGQRLVFSKAFAALAARVFGGNPWCAAVAATASLTTVLGLLLMRVPRRTSGDPIAAVATALCVLVFLRAYTLSGWSNPTYVQYALCLLFFSAAVATLARSGRPLHLILALALAGCATLASGHGVLVWPALTFIAWRFELGPRVSAIIALSAIAMIALYVGVFQTDALFLAAAPDQPLQPASEASFTDRLQLAVNVLGQPWVKVPVLRPLGFGAGLLFIAASIAVLARACRRTIPFEPGDALPVCLIGFGVGAAALTGVFRVDEGVLAVTRYGVIAATAHAALVVWCSRHVGPGPIARRWRVALVALACVWVAEQPVVGRTVWAAAHEREASFERVRAGSGSEADRLRLHPNADRVAKLLDELASARR